MTCPECSGSGLHELPHMYESCPLCDGTGQIADYIGLEMTPVGVECDACGGTGKKSDKMTLNLYRFDHSSRRLLPVMMAVSEEEVADFLCLDPSAVVRAMETGNLDDGDFHVELT